MILMKEKPYIIRGNTWCEGSVVKISYGKVYVIAKCKSQPDALKRIENGLNAFIRGGKNNPAGIYYHLYNYVKDHPNNKFKVETLLESDSAYELLKKEHLELDKGKNNSCFLNNQTQPLIPEYNDETDMFGWIKKNEVLNYGRWLKSYLKAKRIKKIASTSLP